MRLKEILSPEAICIHGEAADQLEAIGKLVQLQKENPDKLKAYAKLLYDQALLIEGMSIEDPVAFSNQICELMA